jgi:hypothetical protein
LCKKQFVVKKIEDGIQGKKAGNECYGLKELVLLYDISQRLIRSKE